MYQYDNGQISIDEFGQPVGVKLHAENRWVKKAMIIPWGAIEHRYAALFTNQKGNVAKPLRLGLGACIIQAEYGFSDVELTQMLQEHPYFQYFCGYKAYDDSKPPFDPSMMVYFRKRLTPEILGEINEMVLMAQDADKRDDDNDGSNSGTMIVDATCAPSQIKYPQDAALLNEARENTEAMIDALHTSGNKKPRTYRKRAHK
ncbi:MAG: transposase, partial [Ruthenibacterium sp.]